MLELCTVCPLQISLVPWRSQRAKQKHRNITSPHLRQANAANTPSTPSTPFDWTRHCPRSRAASACDHDRIAAQGPNDPIRAAMETSAPKRRRTSPRTAVPVQPESESTTPRDAPPRPAVSPSRPSYASPTRASLERFNPEILRRRESQAGSARSPHAPPTASRVATPDSTASLARALHTQLELRSGTRDGAQAASEQSSVLRSPAKRLGAAAAAATRPIPRPLPPPGPDEEEDLLSGAPDRALARSLGVLPEVTAPEPQLPPTPERPDPVVSTPPSGIHNTPSKRPRRNRALAEKIKSSSPLKQPPLRPSEQSQKGAPLPLNLPTKTAQVVEPPPPGPTTAELRGLEPVDPDAEKKKLRDSLLAELRELERDLDIASRENERIRQARLAKREPSPPANKHEILQVLRRHALPPEDQHPEPDPADPLLASALNPIAFLPFSKPSASRPPALPEPAENTTAAADDDDLPPPVSHHPIPMTAEEALPYLQVFTPLTFTAHVSPLPRTTNANADADADADADTPNGNATDDGQPILQHHSITATSTSPRGLFSARLDMTVNTQTLAITSLAVPRLDPAAEAELRPFVDSVVGAGAKDDSAGGLRNNVGVLAWAMGEWLRVAVQRARVWTVLEREVGAGKEALSEMVVRWRTDQGRKRKKRRKRKKWAERSEGDGGASEGEEGDEEGEQQQQQQQQQRGGEGDVDGEGKFEAAELLPFMGRTCMDFEVPLLEGRTAEVSALRVQWRIKFDWTGEARSDIGVLVGVPGKCEFFSFLFVLLNTTTLLHAQC